MKLAHQVKLYDALENWFDEVSREGHPQLVYDDLVDDMLRAAAVVYDACAKGQAFAEREKS